MGRGGVNALLWKNEGEPRRGMSGVDLGGSTLLSPSHLAIAVHVIFPTIDDVRGASDRLVGRVHRTPVLRSSELDRRLGASVFFKCENFQRVGAFKARGAMNAVFSLSDEVAARGVVAHSSGNHAAAVALAARERGVAAHIAVPRDTAKIKVEAVLRYGGKLYFTEPTMAAREARAAELLAETGGTLVHPFSDPRVIAGQGTAAWELHQEVPGLDLVMAPVSGGGLLSGTALATKALAPKAQVWGGEPANADDAARSFAAGVLISSGNRWTVADGLRAALSPLTFSLLRDLDVRIATASEAEIVAAMRYVWDVMKIVIEPSCAVPLAALLSGAVPDVSGKRIGVILSGGNVDLDALPWQPKA